MEEIKWLAQLGVGGVLAGIMIAIYRKDRKDSEKTLARFASEFSVIVKENTRAISTWVQLMQSLENRSAKSCKRKADGPRPPARRK